MGSATAMRGDQPGAPGRRVDVCQFDGAATAETFAAGWLHAADAKTRATVVVQIPEPAVA
ncbi:MAG: hypothetical protein IT208_01145 [Chthonomonadales bacterium]|nr:hypothetical protein [Chthonomonadales bacterium]